MLAAACFLTLPSSAASEPEPRAVMLDYYRSHAAVDYQFGACSRRRMDCSCFVQRLYRDHFELRLPRDTLKQVRSMRYLRVKTLKQPSQLTEDKLCVGDLIYTYRGRSWRTGRRHVTVYAGARQLLHASAQLDGVGISPLSWVRQFQLKGVFRPLGC